FRRVLFRSQKSRPKPCPRPGPVQVAWTPPCCCDGFGRNERRLPIDMSPQDLTRFNKTGRENPVSSVVSLQVFAENCRILLDFVRTKGLKTGLIPSNPFVC